MGLHAFAICHSWWLMTEELQLKCIRLPCLILGSCRKALHRGPPDPPAEVTPTTEATPLRTICEVFMTYLQSWTKSSLQSLDQGEAAKLLLWKWKVLFLLHLYAAGAPMRQLWGDEKNHKFLARWGGSTLSFAALLLHEAVPAALRSSSRLSPNGSVLRVSSPMEVGWRERVSWCDLNSENVLGIYPDQSMV